MSYGPDGLAPKNLSTGYADGAVGHSALAAAGVLALILTIPVGVLIAIDGNLPQGLAFAAGGILIAVSFFRPAAQRAGRMSRSHTYVSSLGRYDLVAAIALMLTGILVLLLGMILL